MDPATQIALAATLGNLLQGWDNGAIAGALLYLKPELGIQGNPIIEGIVVGSTLVGALLSTIFSGPGSDWLGRRAILIVSGVFYTTSSAIMLWSPTVLVLILSRLLVGSGLGIAVTVIPIYIAETAPPEIRGTLSTLPQFMGSVGLFLAYSLCFFFSLWPTPNWRIMLALLMAPSLLFLALAILYLPESPRWLVSKGKMLEARLVLQRLRNKTDISAELALLVEGLGVGSGGSLEEWVLEPAPPKTKSNGSSFLANGSSQHVLYTPEDGGVSWIAKPLLESDPTHSSFSQAGGQSPFVDPLVALIGNLTNVSVAREQENYESDVEKGEGDLEEGGEEAVVGEIEELLTPLLRRRASSKSVITAGFLSRPSSMLGVTHSSSGVNGTTVASPVVSAGIGSGWQLAWEWDNQERGGPLSATKNTNMDFRRVFLLQEGAAAAANISGSLSVSARSLPGMVEDGGGNAVVDQSIQAAALIGRPAQSFHNLVSDKVVGPAMVHPVETAIKGPAWSDLLEVGVRRALVVGVLLQILQQFSGINAVLYFVPQILQQSGADELLARLGLGSASASILASGVTCLIMLPCIGLAMRLMDVKGRRQILLVTLPILFLSLVTMVISSTLVPAGILQAAASFVGVTVYVCVFVMGFGPIPNILGSEIFPTRVRGLCIGMCQASMWTCNIILTNMFPTLLGVLGIGGLFGCFAVVVLAAWIFTLFKVPETKGMPLEVISEFFAMDAASQDHSLKL
ncbi:hypothetical protein SELMODRAFT_182142 [Selaginella moellendorffii]|uniref:Uncharacterized protein TMT3-1 n=1 Tax=Selaginella moellendorffii TaxID=88036 RepID=D8SRR8_SELML|nr:monosaccharide-sensing protein 2 [Selaginella moellendorffii]EFJ12833.1 hypothetical protein SELMODRAFT_182142 [Selaginella moellendorffii]|eukprot:XP_002986014.1 monosaccharide-sensing protein 2 [Selaginella moellendorffii]